MKLVYRQGGTCARAVSCVQYCHRRKKAASTRDGWQITPEWLLDEFSYADNIALLAASSERGLQTLNDLAKSVAATQISRPKTMLIQSAHLSLIQYCNGL
jgi:hypothetical protein